MEYIYSVEFKDKKYKTISTLNLGSNFGCLTGAIRKLEAMDLKEFTSNPKIVKIWLMMNNERQATLPINQFKR